MSRSVERAQALLALLDAEDIDGAEAKAEQLWAIDQEAFWWLLDEQVARGRHSLALGMVLMRAVKALPRPDHDALGRIFRLAVQRMVPEHPQPEAKEVLECAQLLRASGAHAELPPWLLLGLASAHTHHLRWLASKGEEDDLTQGLRQITELFTELTERSLSGRDHLQFAAALAHYAGLTGDGHWLPVARRSLEVARERYPGLGTQCTLAVLGKFAIATEDATLWQELIEYGEPLLLEAEPAELEALIRHKRRREDIYYNLAVAYGFLGEKIVGLSYLAESIKLNSRRLHMAMTDRDLAPLYPIQISQEPPLARHRSHRAGPEAANTPHAADARGDNDPRGTVALISATSHLLSCVSEHLDSASVAFARRVEAEGVTSRSLVDAGRVLGLAEVVHKEADELVSLALEEDSYRV